MKRTRSEAGMEAHDELASLRLLGEVAEQMLRTLYESDQFGRQLNKRRVMVVETSSAEELPWVTRREPVPRKPRSKTTRKRRGFGAAMAPSSFNSFPAAGPEPKRGMTVRVFSAQKARATGGSTVEASAATAAATMEKIEARPSLEMKKRKCLQTFSRRSKMPKI